MDAGLRLWLDKLVPVIHLMHFTRQPGGGPEFASFAKEFLRARGGPDAWPRKPFTPVDDAMKTRIRDLVAQLGLAASTD